MSNKNIYDAFKPISETLQDRVNWSLIQTKGEPTMNKKYWAVAYPNGDLRPCNTRKRASTLVRRYNAKYGLRGTFQRALVVPLEQQVIEKRISMLEKIRDYIMGRV